MAAVFVVGAGVAGAAAALRALSASRNMLPVLPETEVVAGSRAWADEKAGKERESAVARTAAAVAGLKFMR